jgi:hypothetical protein
MRLLLQKLLNDSYETMKPLGIAANNFMVHIQSLASKLQTLAPRIFDGQISNEIERANQSIHATIAYDCALLGLSMILVSWVGASNGSRTQQYNACACPRSSRLTTLFLLLLGLLCARPPPAARCV